MLLVEKKIIQSQIRLSILQSRKEIYAILDTYVQIFIEITVLNTIA